MIYKPYTYVCVRVVLIAANVPAHIRTHIRTRVYLDAATNTYKKHKFVIITTKDKNQKHTQNKYFCRLFHFCTKWNNINHLFSACLHQKMKKNKGEPVPSGTHTVYIVRPFFSISFFQITIQTKITPLPEISNFNTLYKCQTIFLILLLYPIYWKCILIYGLSTL